MKNIFIILLVGVFFLSPVSVSAQSAGGATKGCFCMGRISVTDAAASVIDSNMEGQIKKNCESVGGSYSSPPSCSDVVIAVSVAEAQCNDSTLQDSLLQKFGIPSAALSFVNNEVDCIWSDIPPNVPVVNFDAGGASGSQTGGGGSSGGSSGGSGGGSFNFGTYQQTVSLDNPLASGTTSVTVILGGIIKTVMGLMGGVVLLMIVWGGFTWLSSMGNPEKVKKGTNMIMWAVLGAVIVLSSYFLLTNVLKLLAG